MRTMACCHRGGETRGKYSHEPVERIHVAMGSRADPGNRTYSVESRTFDGR